MTGAYVLLLGILLAQPVPESPVADAAQRNDVAAVQALLQRGADVNVAQGDGMTALHWAAANGSVELTQVLLAAGANPRSVTRLGGYTALHLAGKVGSAPVIQALIQAGGDVRVLTTTGAVTALHFAALSGQADAVTALLDHGADPNARETVWGHTPLMFAAAANRVDAINVLLRRGADAGLAARVIDLPARDTQDRAAEKQRDERLAAQRDSRPAERAAPSPPERPREQAPGERPAPPEGTDPLTYAQLVGGYGGLTPLLLAAREGHAATVGALLEGGALINQVSAGDHTGPLLMATINGHFDLAKLLLERGADPNLTNDAGIGPLYATLNAEWAPKSRHPQPTDYLQQRTRYLELAETLLNAGADPNARLSKSPWFDTYGDDYLGVDRMGATPFWRAAYATDVPAMRLLVAHGGDPNIPTRRPPEQRRRGYDDQKPGTDPSGLPPVPVGGPGVWPIHAASGAGYGEGYAGNVHRHVPDGWLPAVKYLVEELGADVNARDYNGYAPLHHAAARGDNQLILYLVSRGADVTAVSRKGQTTADMANGPVQRISPFPETVALLEKLGSKNHHRCVSC